MSILNKIKENAARIFGKKMNKKEEIIPNGFAIDMSEQDDFTSYAFSNVPSISSEVLDVINKIGRGKEPTEKLVNKRLKKATHIYESTKNKRIKNKQLKIMKEERNRYGSYSGIR